MDPAAVVRIFSPDGAGPFGFGVVIKDGRIATCAHVVCDALGIARDADVDATSVVSVQAFSDSKLKSPATIVGWSGTSEDDAAVLKVGSSTLGVSTPLAEAASGALVAFYTPMAGGRVAGAVIEGPLVAPRFQIRRRDPAGYWIEPGTSGSPVFDAWGRVIGLVRSVDTPTDVKVGTFISVTALSPFLELAVEPAEPPNPALAKYSATTAAIAESQLAQFTPIFPRSVDVEGEAHTRLSEVVTSRRFSRLLVLGDGGAGKSQMVASLVSDLVAEGHLTAWIDLKGWSEQDSRDLNAADDNDGQVEVLMRYSAVDEMSVQFLESLDDGSRSVAMVIDALNEVGEPRDSPDSHPRLVILKTADEFLRQHFTNRSSCTAASRTIPFPTSRWTEARVQPIAEEVVLRVLAEGGLLASEPPSGRTMELLTSPFFLNWALDSRSVEHDSMFSAIRVRIPEPSEALGLIAFEMYADHRSTSVPARLLKNDPERIPESDQEWIEKLQDTLRFRHQLIQDFFAASQIVRRWEESSDSVRRETQPVDELWLEVFEGVSFGGIESDCLLMSVQMLEQSNPPSILPFLMWVYDWNYSIALDCVASPIEADGLYEFAYVIGALRSERRFDMVGTTAESAEASLDRLSRRYPDLNSLRTASRAELIEEVSSGFRPAAEWSTRWKDLFVGVLDPSEAVDSVGDPRSIVGWTAANVLKREVMDPLPEARAIGHLVAHRVPPAIDSAFHKTARWRFSYLLGSGADLTTANVLVEGLNDDYWWVRSGH